MATKQCKVYSKLSLCEQTPQVHGKTSPLFAAKKYSYNDTHSKTIIYRRGGEIKTDCTLKAQLYKLPRQVLSNGPSPERRGLVRQGYLQQASAPREVWLSRLLSVSDATVGSLLGSVVSVDMDETSLAEEEAEEEEVA